MADPCLSTLQNFRVTRDRDSDSLCCGFCWAFGPYAGCSASGSCLLCSSAKSRIVIGIRWVCRFPSIGHSSSSGKPLDCGNRSGPGGCALLRYGAGWGHGLHLGSDRRPAGFLPQLPADGCLCRPGFLGNQELDLESQARATPASMTEPEASRSCDHGCQPCGSAEFGNLNVQCMELHIIYTEFRNVARVIARCLAAALFPRAALAN